MKLTPKISGVIDARFADVRPQGFYAKVRALTTCDEFSPRLTEREARGLLAQRRRKQNQKQAFTHDEARFRAMKASRPDLYD